MEKNIYDLLNEVTIDFSEYDEEAFTHIEKIKIKNNLKKSMKKNHSLYKKCTAASIALLIIGLLTTNLGNHVLAYANAIAYDISSFLGIEKSLDAYKTVVNKSITKNNVTIQLNEVVLDHNQLVVSATSTFHEKLDKDSMVTLFSSIYINGKRADYGSSGSSKQIDNHTVEEVMFHDLEGDLSGDLNIKVVFSDVLVNEKTKSGDWIFEFKTNGDELRLDTKEILLNYAFTLENLQNITLEKYTSNHLGQKIYYAKSPQGTNYDMVLRGHDDLGNKIEFYASRETAHTGLFQLSTIDGNLDENAKILSLTPYAVKLPEQSGQLSNDFKKVGEEFTIDLLK